MYRESAEALEYFCHYAEQQTHSLLIIVINRPDTDSDDQWAQTIHQQLSPPSWSKQNLSLHTLNNNSGLLLIDRCIHGDPIPHKQGVGLARKIANDVACQLIQLKALSSPWIFNTDADALLPEKYFTASNDCKKNTSALLFPFKHVQTDGSPAHLATQIYELSLHYYVQALAWAESPYAHHSLGSIIALHHYHYAVNRGFPKRAAGEDFYLLNKLAKTGSILTVEKPHINLLCRQSDRVPFGTGPAVSKIIQQNDYCNIPFYPPVLFHYLKAFNQLLKQLAIKAGLRCALDQILPAGLDKQLLKNACVHLQLDKAIYHAHQHANTPEKRLKHLQIWFDAFKTLKLVHFIRDKEHAMIPYKQWQQIIKNEPYSNKLPMLKDV